MGFYWFYGIVGAGYLLGIFKSTWWFWLLPVFIAIGRALAKGIVELGKTWPTFAVVAAALFVFEFFKLIAGA